MPTQSEAGAFVERFERAWATSNADRLRELLAHDVVLVTPLLPTTRGRGPAHTAFRRLLRLIPDLHVTVHDWAAHRDVVFIDFTLSGTFGGRELRWRAVDRIVLRDGLIAERRSYFDAATLAIQLIVRPRGWGRLLRAV
jgi:ketosteroid isomerase-like protein